MDITMRLSDETIKISYRYYGKVVEDTGNYTLACLQTRHHNGYIRQGAVESLLNRTIANEMIAAHCLLALCDYVIEISMAVVDKCSDDLREVMIELIDTNQDVFDYIKAKCISYWNEYYRDRYAIYKEYPPYKFLDSFTVRVKI